MAEPFRLRVIKALTAAIAQIEPDSNTIYNFDLTQPGRVIFGRNTIGDTEPLPMVAILETPIPLDQVPSPEEQAGSSGLWDISIQGFVKDDKTQPTAEAYLLAADVIVRLALEKKNVALTRERTGKPGLILGEKNVTDIFIGSPVHRPADEQSSKAYFWLNITLKVAENLDDPYL